ncbi:MAG: hypothetical protein C5B53_04365 [Candidatus Melainabacteria bacterium]|nr:MAG: hypothetical protein C5B53_04365 [Candidatus Melainabacteria bacterium]
MNRQTGSLIFGIVLLVILAGYLGPTLASGAMPGTHQLILSGALLLFAVSRFIMFKSPDSGIIGPMRTVALIGVIASFVVK